MKTTQIIRMVLVVGGAMCSAAGRAEAGSFAINVQLGGGPNVAVPAPATPVTMAWNNQPVATLAGYAGTGRYFRIDVPEGQTYLNVLTTGGWGDCDLYLARGYLPTPGSNEFAAADPGTEQQVTVLYPAAGTWYVLVHGAQQYGDVSLMSSFWQQASVLCDEPAGVLVPLAMNARNVRVCIAWDRLGWRRPECGLIQFVQRELRERREIRHHVMQPAPARFQREAPAVSRVERPVVSNVERPVVSRVERPVVSRVERPAVSNVERPAVSNVERVAPGNIQAPAVIGRNTINERPAVSRIERPAVTERNPLQDRPAANRIERPAAPSQTVRPAVSQVERPAVSNVERPAVTHAATPAPVRTATPAVQAAPAAVTHAAAPAPAATRAQRIEPNSVPAPTPARAQAAKPAPTPVARAAAPAPVAVTRASAQPAREPAKDRQTAGVRDRQGRDVN